MPEKRVVLFSEYEAQEAIRLYGLVPFLRLAYKTMGTMNDVPFEGVCISTEYGNTAINFKITKSIFLDFDGKILDTIYLQE